MMKYVLVIGDGMADNPVPELGNKTPLQVVNKEAIDQLARKGTVGSVVNCPKGLPAGSDTAILSIFGNDPWKCYTGRSPLEAAATGIHLNPGDVSYRCNMIALEEGDKPYAEKKILSHSGGSIEGEQSIELINYLFDHPDFKEAAKAAGMIVYPAPSFRHIAVQAKVDITGINLIPPHDHLGEVIGPLLPSGCDNAKTLTHLMELSNQILDDHPINQARRAEGKLPANGVWFWAEGTGVALGSFVDKYGKNGTVISAVPLCQGIARLGSLKAVEVEGATGELDTNYEGKTQARPGLPWPTVMISWPSMWRLPTNVPTTGTLRVSSKPSSGFPAAWLALWWRGWTKPVTTTASSSSPITRPSLPPAATMAIRCPTSSTTAALTPTTTCPTLRKLA